MTMATLPADTTVENKFSFSENVEQVRKLVDTLQRTKFDRADVRRKLRDLNIDVEKQRESGRILPDETIINFRVCDTNIRKELPSYAQYLIQPRFAAVFIDKKDPGSVHVQRLSAAFNDVVRYPGSVSTFFKLLDGAITHGWDWLEIELDMSKPGGIGLHHVGYDRLYFPADTENLQACDRIAEKFELKSSKLMQFVANKSFDATQVELLVKKAQESEDANITVFKVFFHSGGVVMVGWMNLETCTDWLKAPVPLFLGVRELKKVPGPDIVDPLTGLTTPGPLQDSWVEVFETEFPFEQLIYAETEQKAVAAHIGRVDMDEFKQEATVSIWSMFINRLHRSAGVYGSPKNDTTGLRPQATDTILQNMHMYSGPMDFYHFPEPSPLMLKAADALDIRTQQETNQPAWAVSNRKDTEKTATEIEAVGRQSAQLSSVQVALFSEFLQKVYIRVWRIVQSLALQGQIEFLFDNTGRQEVELIARKYNIFPAGDEEMKKNETLELLKFFYGLLSQTPSGAPVAYMILLDMMAIALPNYAEKYQRIFNETLPLLAQQQQQQQLSSAPQAEVQSQPQPQ